MTRQKGSRWKRGNACVSNPVSKKHRLEAAAVVRTKRQKTSAVSEKGGLSVALKNLDDKTDNLMVDTDDATQISALSNWTIASEAAGSLPSFERVRKLWNSPLDSHKEVCAVLTAITDVIKQQGEEESPVAYFAALLTAMETATIVEQQTAISYLLSLVIPNVPETILRAKFAPTSKLLFTVLESQSNKDMSVALIRSLLTSITHIFIHQDPAIWSEGSVMRMLEHTIQYVYNNKPKIRHAAQRSLSTLSKSVPAACSLVLRACINTLDKYSGSKEAQVTQHTISFIRYILPHSTESELRAGVESLLRVITMRHTKVTSAALQALAQLFKQETQMTGEMQGQILMNLYSNKPTNYDHPITTVWLEALSAGYANLAKLEPKLGIVMSYSLFSTCSECIVSNSSQVVQIALVVMEEFCVNNLQPGLQEYQDEIKNKKKFPLQKVVDVFKTMLKLTYQSVWDVVLQVLGSFFEHLTCECSYMIGDLITPLFRIRDAPDFENDTLFTKSVGRLVVLLGVEKLLNSHPLSLEIKDTVNIPNGWLLPILYDNISHSQLQYFVKHLIPLTVTLKTKSETLVQEGKVLDARVVSNMEYQIWNLLPSFCKHPTDVIECFAKIAKTMGTLIVQRPAIRNILCTSIITIINTRDESYTPEIAKFAKNFLPILFNIFLSDPIKEDPSVTPVLDCIKAYLSICPTDTLHIFFNKMLEKTKEPVQSEHVSKCLLELLVAMIGHLSVNDLDTMYNYIKPWLEDPSNASRQKRAYQILCSILDGELESHIRFVSSHLDELYKRLAEALALAQPAAKKHRLKCLLSLVKKMDIENMKFIPTILPEVVLCVKELNEKTRLAAFKCIVAIGYVLVDKSPDKKVAIKDYFEMVIGGLTGSTELASATLLCLSKIVYEYNSYLEEDILEQVLEIVVAMLQSKQRSIIKSAISFIKASIGTMPYSVVEAQLQTMLNSFGGWEKSMAHHFRAKVKVILERLLRRFGYEIVYKLSSVVHKKVVNNIVKEQRRAKKSKPINSESEDDSDGLNDDDDDEKMADFKELRGKGSRKEMSSQLIEGDNPLDFLDSTMIPRIYKHEKKDAPMPEKDGKLLIEELSKKIEEAVISDDDADSDDEIVRAANTNPFGRPSKGIHRDIKKEKISKKPYGALSDGTMYKSKKSKGDMSKAGSHDPYAYISLNQQKGKKKKKGQFDKIIKAGKAGVLKGAKARVGAKSQTKSKARK